MPFNDFKVRHILIDQIVTWIWDKCIKLSQATFTEFYNGWGKDGPVSFIFIVDVTFHTIMLQIINRNIEADWVLHLASNP